MSSHHKGGHYGWRWPHGWPTIIEPATIACANAALLTGDPAWLALTRSQFDRLWALGREEEGCWVVPHKHRDGGWTADRPPDPVHPIACWYLSQEEGDLARVERLRWPGDWRELNVARRKGLLGNTAPWFEFIRGRNPAYPEQTLRANLALIAWRVAQLDAEQGDPATWDVYHWQRRTPMICERLVQLTLGAPIHLYPGGCSTRGSAISAGRPGGLACRPTLPRWSTASPPTR